jgi:type IV secretory pathway VirB10-like protein
MRNEPRSTAAGRDRSRAALVRDLALERVSRTRRWLIAAAAALTAGFAALVAAVAPGRSLASKTGSAAPGVVSAGVTSSSSRNGIPAMPPPAKPSELGLQGPDDAPLPDNSQSQGARSQAPSQQSQAQQSQSQPQPQQDPSQAAPAPAPAPPVVSGGS